MWTWAIALPLWIIAVSVIVLLTRLPKDMDAVAYHVRELYRLMNKAREDLSAINDRLKNVSTLQIKDLSSRMEPLDEIRGELVEINTCITSMARRSGAIVGPGDPNYR